MRKYLPQQTDSRCHPAAHRLLIALLLLGATLLQMATIARAQSCGLYTYKAHITEVYDGDTITADIDLGFHTWRRDEKLRLDGINAPEVRGPQTADGVVARDALRKRVLGREVIICTIKSKQGKDKQGKYGRYLAKIFVDGENINDWLAKSGFADYRVY
jgi:micrococcal nuclease